MTAETAMRAHRRWPLHPHGVLKGTLAVAFLLLPATATAQSSAPPPAVDCDQELQTTVTLRQSRQYPLALESALRAVRACPRRESYRNLGLLYFEMARYRESIRALESALGLGDADDPALSSRVQAVLEQARQRTGTLAIQVVPGNARVLVDGVEIANPATPQVLDPGTHVVVTEREGYRSETRSLQVVSGSPSELQITLQPLPPPAPPQGQVSVAADAPTITVLVDGREMGNGQLVSFALTPGRHRLETRAVGRFAATRWIDVRADDTLRLRFSLAIDRGIIGRPWFWVATGGVVSTAVLITTLVLTARPAEAFRGTLASPLEY